MTPTPSKPAPISGYRSRAINAVADFAAALRPVAGPGVRVTDGPGGKIIGIDADAPGEAPRPWGVRSSVIPGATDPATVESVIRLWLGPVCDGDGNVLPLVIDAPVDPAVSRADYDPDNLDLDDVTGLRCARIAPESGPWLVASLAASGYILGWSAAPLAVEAQTGHVLSVAVAYTPWTSTSVCIRPLYPGVVVLGAGSGGLLPFDLEPAGARIYIGPLPAVYVNGEAAAPRGLTIDADGWAASPATPATPGEIWLNIWRDTSSTASTLYWTLDRAAAASAYCLRSRCVAAVASDGAIRQHWHGRVYAAYYDPTGRDLAIDAVTRRLGLRDFDDASTTTPTSTDALVFREYVSGQYRVHYWAYDDLVALIGQLARAAARELLDPSTQPGAQLIALLGGYFQPLVTADSTSDALASSRYVGVEKTPAGVAWEPE